jgi:hypothetical protein
MEADGSVILGHLCRHPGDAEMMPFSKAELEVFTRSLTCSDAMTILKIVVGLATAPVTYR